MAPVLTQSLPWTSIGPRLHSRVCRHGRTQGRRSARGPCIRRECAADTRFCRSTELRPHSARLRPCRSCHAAGGLHFLSSCKPSRSSCAQGHAGVTAANRFRHRLRRSCSVSIISVQSLQSQILTPCTRSLVNIRSACARLTANATGEDAATSGAESADGRLPGDAGASI